MTTHKAIANFLSQYSEDVVIRVETLRTVLLKHLPGIIEQLDIPAKMIGYAYGQKYAELICTIIPSKKGVKLGFNRGTDLPDPHGLLEGTGKISRYIEIQSAEQAKSKEVKQMIGAGLQAYKERMNQ